MDRWLSLKSLLVVRELNHNNQCSGRQKIKTISIWNNIKSIMYFYFTWQRKNDFIKESRCLWNKFDNDIYFLLKRLRSLWKLSQQQSIKFISIFPTELGHDRGQVIYGRPGFLLPVGVHLKATLGSMWPGRWIYLYLISMTTSQQLFFLSTDPRLIALFNACFFI